MAQLQLDSALPTTTARDTLLGQIETTTFDLVIIGGGITGAATARAAARRGLSVVLLEAEDFAAGTSSRSTKLIHGGLRYLALGDVRLVRETARERKVIHELAPHLAEPCWMLLPARERVQWLLWRAAIRAYEHLGAVAAADRHRNWSGAELAREEPFLAPHFRYGTTYREYRTDDVRLVLANLRSAAQSGAIAINYARVTGMQSDTAGPVRVEGQCRLSGHRFQVRAACAINAAGPWVETVRKLAQQSSAPWLHLTRGIHVALPATRLPLRNMVMLRALDDRLMFAIPRGPIVYVGTTDTTYAKRPELWPEVERADVEYVLEALPRHFQIPPVQPREVLSAWAGLRPLVAQPGKSPSAISRRDEIIVGPGRLVSIGGGKLTGYRPMAEAILTRAARLIGRTLPPAPPETPLPGGALDGSLEQCADALLRRVAISPSSAGRLVRLYGAEAIAVAGLGPEPVAPDAPLLQGEIDWAIQAEAAASLEDVFYRRTRAALYEPAAENWLEPIASRMAKLLAWTEVRCRHEVERVRARVRSDLAFRG